MSVLIFCMISGLLIGEYYYYTHYFIRNKIGISFPLQTGLYKALTKRKGTVPVKVINDKHGYDLIGVVRGQSSLKSHEPIFGYRLEGLKANLKVGPTDKIENDYYNLTHPGSLLYPDYFNCQPWERIKVSDKKNFDLFINGKTPLWRVPPWQGYILWTNFFFIVLFLILLLFIPTRKKSVLDQ